MGLCTTDVLIFLLFPALDRKTNYMFLIFLKDRQHIKPCGRSISLLLVTMCHDVLTKEQPHQYQLILHLAESMCMIHFSCITYTACGAK